MNDITYFLYHLRYIPLTQSETYFFLLSAIILTVSSINQYISILNYHIIPLDKLIKITNKERIIIQIKGLLQDHSNILPFYGLFISTLIITITVKLFHIGSNQTPFLYILLTFMLISFVIEYHIFLMNVAVKAEEHNVSIEDELTTREQASIRTPFTSNNINKIKELFQQLPKNTTEKFYEENLGIITEIFINLNEGYPVQIEKVKEILKKQKSFFKKNGLDRISTGLLLRMSNYTIYDIYLQGDALKIDKIELVPSVAYFSFYKELPIKSTLTKAIFEGIIVSFILLMSMTLTIIK